jgi:FkbM family methyltransferase
MNWLNPAAVNQHSVVTKLRGFPIQIEYDPNSYIGRFIYFRGIYEEQIAGAIASALRPGMTFVDIGANIGQHTCIAASVVGAAGRVIAIEPQLLVRERLERNVARNCLLNVDVISNAIGAEIRSGRLIHRDSRNDGQASLASEEGDISQSFETVEIRPLAAVMADLDVAHADVMKIDVEGAEMNVFQGAESFLCGNLPSTIFVECIDGHLGRFGNSSAQLIGWLHDHGYVVRALLRGGRWRLVERGSAASANLMASLV